MMLINYPFFTDLDVVEKVRANIPVFSQRRLDVYDTVQKN